MVEHRASQTRDETKNIFLLNLKCYTERWLVYPTPYSYKEGFNKRVNETYWFLGIGCEAKGPKIIVQWFNQSSLAFKANDSSFFHMELACERSYCSFKIPFKKIHIISRIQISSLFLTICNKIIYLHLTLSLIFLFTLRSGVICDFLCFTIKPISCQNTKAMASRQNVSYWVSLGFNTWVKWWQR